MYEPWFSRDAAEDLSLVRPTAVKAILARLDLICSNHLARQAESFSINVPSGLRVALSVEDAGVTEWYFFDYQIAREQYLLVIAVAGPFRRIP